MSQRGRKIWGLLVLGLVFALAAPASSFAEKLPVFKLEKAKVDKAKGRGLFMKSMGGSPTEKENPNAVEHRSGKKVVEIDKRSGHIFMADMEKMWNPKARANIPDKNQAKEKADRFLRDNKLLPKHEKRVKVDFSHHTETVGGKDTPNREEKQVLDRQVTYKMDITVRGPGGKEKTLPIVGGGGKFQVTVGDRGSVVGFQGGWREISGVESEVEILPQANAEGEFKKGLGKLKIKKVSSRLGYYAAPAFEEQAVLAPVWIVDGEVEIGGETIPTRSMIIPATSHGPKMEKGPPAKKRAPNEPKPRDHEPGDEAPGKGKSSLLDLPGVISDALFPPAYASPGFECGTEWIGTSQGLSGSSGNKQGFVDQCRAAGWSVNFDYGDYAAWERDFRANDDAYVDSVDLLFYTGHASQNGWTLNSPDDTNGLRYTEVGTSPGSDIYGNTDLEWLIVAACGPLQSTHFTTNTTNAFSRWRGIFDGLHVFMGYGAVTYDNTSEGRRFMQLARAGWNVIDAWFRTAKEIQPSTNGYGAPNGPRIYVVAMYAHNGDHCARNDHLWGMGSTCADVRGSGQQRYMMWSGT